jgi:ferric-dicitrate binding protein FerR (iron transport regulator)
VKAQPFTGTAHIDRIEAWLQALPHVLPVAVAELADGSLLISPLAGKRSD